MPQPKIDISEYVLEEMRKSLGETGMARLRNCPTPSDYTPLLRSLFSTILSRLNSEQQNAHLHHLVEIQHQNPTLNAFEAEHKWFQQTCTALLATAPVDMMQWRENRATRGETQEKAPLEQ